MKQVWKNCSFETKAFLSLVIIVLIGICVYIGPEGFARKFGSWKASSYGTDWLIVQYSLDGKVVNHWKLNGKSVGNEENSDGIYFVDNDGNVAHLSGHYVYVEVKNDNWKKAMEKYAKGYKEDGSQ